MSKILMEGKPVEEFFKEALNNPEVPKIYANGFTSGLGAGDVTLIFQLSQKPIAMLNMSFTLAKTLSQKLSKMILELEHDTGNTIMTTDEIGIATGLMAKMGEK